MLFCHVTLLSCVQLGLMQELKLEAAGFKSLILYKIIFNVF